MRGNSLGVDRVFSMQTYPPFASSGVSLRSPSWPRPVCGHLALCGTSGGSETMRSPETLRNLVAHSAVEDGGPKDLATTKSKASDKLRSHARSSALPSATLAPSGASGAVIIERRNRHLFSIESRSTVWQFQISSRTSPGTPPPEPKSNTLLGVPPRSSFHASTYRRACSTWASTGPGPKKPSALDCSRALESHSIVTG